MSTPGQPPEPGHGGKRAETAPPARHVDEARIAGQKLIAAKPGDRDLEASLACRFRDEPRVDAVDRGLVHGLENCREIVQELALSDTPHDVVRPIALGDQCGKRRLVLIRAAELLEGQRDGADVALARVPHQTEQRAGIDARRKKYAHLDIGKKMRAHAIGHRRAHNIGQFGRREAALGDPPRGSPRGWRRASARAGPRHRSTAYGLPAAHECRGRA